MANCSRYSIGTYVYGHTLLAVVTVEQTVNGLQVLVVITLDLYQYGQLWSLLYRYICLWTNSVSCGYCGVDCKWPTGPCCKYLGPVPDMANCGRYSISTYVYRHTLLAVVTVEQNVNGLQVQLWPLLYT